MTGRGGPVFNSQRHLIEQAIARGESTERICSALNVTPAKVADTRDDMDRAIAEDDADDEPAVPTPPRRVRPSPTPKPADVTPPPVAPARRVGQTPGFEALAEAMRLEQARVYGQLQREHRQPAVYAATAADVVELSAERKRRRIA